MLTVAETPLFIKQSEAIFSDDERQELLAFLAKNPLSGDIIPGTGGVRKLRFQASGKGKRGGARVVYFYHNDDYPLYALAAYAKSSKADMTAAEKKALSALVATFKAERRRKR